MMIRMTRTRVAFALCLTLCACAQRALFQPAIIQDVDTNFDFPTWRETPTTSQGHKVQLGGRIVQANPSDKGVMIVAAQLPIVEHPAYGPRDTGRRPGVFEFAFFFPGRIEATALTAGNRFIVVGTIQRPKAVNVEGAFKNQPFLLARCVHIWNTQGQEIAEFTSVGADYYPLSETTYCAAGE